MFTVILFAVVLCAKMIILAERHRKKIKICNTMKTSRADSVKFLAILVVTYIISNIIPGKWLVACQLCKLIEEILSNRECRNGPYVIYI